MNFLTNIFDIHPVGFGIWLILIIDASSIIYTCLSELKDDFIMMLYNSNEEVLNKSFISVKKLRALEKAKCRHVEL